MKASLALFMLFLLTIVLLKISDANSGNSNAKEMSSDSFFMEVADGTNGSFNFMEIDNGSGEDMLAIESSEMTDVCDEMLNPYEVPIEFFGIMELE